MRKFLHLFSLTTALTLFGAASAIAQSVVTGKVVDENNVPLAGAAIVVPGSTSGTSSDVDGTFTLKTAPKAHAVEVSFVGYQPTIKEFKGEGNIKLGVIVMQPDAIAMQDVIITQSLAVQRKTPVAVSSVSAADIDYKLGTQEFPEILKSTPGTYATKSGGGYGDSQIRLRGFSTENIAIMVNGVPMNDMEGGKVYWSNWAGLSDVTRSMQVQRGLGASKISAPSVGGSINIVTNTIDAQRGGTASVGMGNDGLYNVSFSVSSGLTKSGWAMTVMGAKRWANGYVQGTDYTAYNWFVNISKRINDRHQLSLTAFGSPQ
ncbi:MAG: TonB-dependent receptor, partial [Alistipes sp.]|nr:TonB-dependent receptor [Alistipes sp.]